MCDHPKGLVHTCLSDDLKGKITLPSYNPHWMVHTKRSTWDDDPENHRVSEACMKRQNRELKDKASSPEDFDEELKIKKRRGNDAFPLAEKIIEVDKPTHKFPKWLYHEGRTGLTYPKKHHTDSCGISCVSKTSGYCLYQKMFGYCSARRSELDKKALRDHGHMGRHTCNKCRLTRDLAFEPICREEDYGQYRCCGYIPQNGRLPIVTAYFGRRGLGYEGDSELIFNQEEGRIQPFEEPFSSLPEPDEDSVQLCETKITPNPSNSTKKLQPPPIKKSQPPPIKKSQPPPEPINPILVIKMYRKPLLPLLHTSARTVPLTRGHTSPHPPPIPTRPIVNSPRYGTFLYHMLS